MHHVKLYSTKDEQDLDNWNQRKYNEEGDERMKKDDVKQDEETEKEHQIEAGFIAGNTILAVNNKDHSEANLVEFNAMIQDPGILQQSHKDCCDRGGGRALGTTTSTIASDAPFAASSNAPFTTSSSTQGDITVDDEEEQQEAWSLDQVLYLHHEKVLRRQEEDHTHNSKSIDDNRHVNDLNDNADNGDCNIKNDEDDDDDDDDSWKYAMVSVQSRDAFWKWIEATIYNDPVMKIMSSEIGVQQEFRRDKSRSSIVPQRRDNNQTPNNNQNDDRSLPTSNQIPLDLILARTMDTLEDIAVHLARLPKERDNPEKGTAARWNNIPEQQGQEQDEQPTTKKRKTVVVLGTGWAAHAFLKVADPAKVRLIVVSPTNHFVFTPMLASSSVGTVEYRSMTEAVRSANPMIDDYLEGRATDVDVRNQHITVQLNSLLDNNTNNLREKSPPTFQLKYDHLIVSVGCQIDDRGVPGADIALRLKTIDDAVKLRKAVGECLEYASRPDVAGPEHYEERRKRATFLIVGGGPTGVELAGELLDLAADITRPHKGAYPRLKEDIQIVLVHSGPELVPQFDERLRIEALQSLERKGARVYLNTRVKELGEDFATLSTKVQAVAGAELASGTGEVMEVEVDKDFYKPDNQDSGVGTAAGSVRSENEFRLETSGVKVWCAGTKPVDFVGALLEQLPPEARNGDGRIKVDKWLRPYSRPSNSTMDVTSTSYPASTSTPTLTMGSILVLGDAAAFPEGDETITQDKLLPATAQVAGQQGAYAARLMTRGYDLTRTPPVLKCMEGSDKEERCQVEEFDPWMIHWLQIRGIDTAPPFAFLNLGLLAYLGGGEALTQIQLGDVPLFSYFGSIAFILWRSVYLVKQVATRNRVLITFDWIKSAIFGRDMTRF